MLSLERVELFAQVGNLDALDKVVVFVVALLANASKLSLSLPVGSVNLPSQNTEFLNKKRAMRKESKKRNVIICWHVTLAKFVSLNLTKRFQLATGQLHCCTAPTTSNTTQHTRLLTAASLLLCAASKKLSKKHRKHQNQPNECDTSNVSI